MAKIKAPIFMMWYLLAANTTFAYTHADTLRGSNGRGRNWWDVTRYDLQVSFDTLNRSITGTNLLTFTVNNAPHDSLQLDLQEPMILDSVVLQAYPGFEKNVMLHFAREGNVWWIIHPFHKLKVGSSYSIMAYYHGVPRAAIRPPWDGGFSWEHDNNGTLWVSVSCQGLGASCWWPCKDAQWDEPDSGMIMRFYVPGFATISNGRPLQVDEQTRKSGLSAWEVKNPINNYDVTFYIGDYVHWHDTLLGEKGVLDLDFYVLRYNEEKARKQFAVVKQMIHCYEYWLGPYPFYEDGYKLVEAPYLGMEHQGAIAYGNKFKMGYLGFDRSLTRIGLEFDYIIIHESGHEWFGNNITANDMADNWIHEGITTYSESLFAECLLGKENGQKYAKGSWHNIENLVPVIANYGVNEEGPGDIYEKGAAVIYMIREMVGDDEKFRAMMRGLNKTFYHQVVATQQVEDYITTQTGLDLKPFFDQYLRTADLPTFEYYIRDGQLHYRLLGMVVGLSLPIRITDTQPLLTLHATGKWQQCRWTGPDKIQTTHDFLVKQRKVEGR